MPKSLILGNGNVLVGLDKFAQVSDFYFPHVGQEEQIWTYHVHKIGIWVDSKFSWVDDGSWEISIDYTRESLVSQIESYNHNLKIKLEFQDTVYNETDIFLRKVTVYNLGNQERKIKIFFHQSFEISESLRGDTAFFDPVRNVIVHYKGRRVFLINVVSDTDRFNDYSVGNYFIEGKEGTFKDAEDGVLAKNPIEHGLVDSVVSYVCSLPAESSHTLYYWIAAAHLIQEVNELNAYVLKKSPQHLLKTTEDFWRAWVNKQDLSFCNLGSPLIDLFKKSLLIVRTHVDNKGAIIAAGDSDVLKHGKDNYSYVWPRDGALVALSLDKVGDDNIAKLFFEFCNEVITEDGYFMHKYLTDRSLGASWHPWIHDGQLELPIQEDETALVIIALREHFEVSRDLEFIESIYNSLIKKAADFMVSFRDKQTKLPKQSYDLWEEKFGIHTFTAAAVFGALQAAGDFARLLGKVESSQLYQQAAEEIREGILHHLYDENEGYFYKRISFDGDKVVVDRLVDSSSAYGVFKFGVLDVEDERLKKAFQKTEEVLRVQTPVGGIARYEGDYYYRVGTSTPGNPWFITTFWLCQYQIAQAKNGDELEKAGEWFKWVLKNALPSGILSEQLNPYTGEQISVAPLAWSHSELLVTILQYLQKSKELGLCEETKVSANKR